MNAHSFFFLSISNHDLVVICAKSELPIKKNISEDAQPQKKKMGIKLKYHRNVSSKSTYCWLEMGLPLG